MPQAFDTVGIFRTSGGGADTVFTAATVAGGDTLTVRNAAQGARVTLERFMSNGPAGSGYRVRSPLLHDVAEGIQIFPGQNPSAGDISAYAAQQLEQQDTLIAEALINAGAASGAFALGIAYSDLPGTASRLHSWADIANLIKNVKLLRVTMGAGGAVGVWLDTLLTTTENLLHANSDYAVLGYVTDTALTAVGIKGIDTGNLRVCGPGVVDTKVTKDYFINQSNEWGAPRIPVINSANGGGIFASAFHSASPSAANIQFMLAELAHTV